MRRWLSVLAALAAMTFPAACGNGSDTAAPTTAASPTSAPDLVTTDGGFVMGGYRVMSVDPTSTGLTAPPDLEGATGYRYSKDGTEVAVGLQGLLPESESPSDESLKRVLVEVAGGGAPTEIGLGDQRGFVVDGGQGLVYVGNLLEDGTVNVVRGSDLDTLVAMLIALNQATSSAQ